MKAKGQQFPNPVIFAYFCNLKTESVQYDTRDKNRGL